MADAFYGRRGLNTEIYARRTPRLPVVEGDVEFYLELAREAPGRTLELGCGTGRVLVALARAGIEVTGLDLSAPMLDEAEEALAREPGEVSARIELVEGDMSGFEIGEQFGFVYIAFRSFMMLRTVEEQRACLECVHRHLVPGGLLAIDLFDPVLHRMGPGQQENGWRSLGWEVHPDSFNVVRIEVLDRNNNVVNQVFEETWRFTEVGTDGVVRQEEEVLKLRWTYRYEMRHLLELCGFEVLAEYSDYKKAPPAYGKELLFVARKALTPGPSPDSYVGGEGS
jgi:SAM-dependent methyltransferase